MSTRLLIKTSEVNATPQPSDLIARELAFSFVSDGLFIKYPDNTVRRINLNGNGEWGNIVGTLSEQTDLVAALNNKQNLLSPGAGININSGQISVDYNAIANKPTLGNSAILNTGTTAGTVAMGNHTHTKANIGLDQVDNTSDINKPISNAVQTALNNKQDRLIEGANITIDENGVISATGVGGSTIISWSAIQNKPDTFPPSTHYHSKADVGLDQVDNTSDLDKPLSNATQTALDGKIDSTHVGVANGVAALDANADIPMENIPDSLKGAFSYRGEWDANVNSPLLTNAQAIVNKGFCYKVTASGNTNLSGITDWGIGDYVVANGSSWDKWKASSDVTSVAGKKGIVTLVKADVGLSNVDNTSDANKPISSAVQTALDAKETAVNKGQSNGYASLDGSAKIPVSQIPSSIASALTYVSEWNAANNTPAIPTASSNNKGNFYIVSVPGATTINGLNIWNASDWILSTGSAWIRVQVKNDVDSVAGKQGVITLEIADINGLQSALNAAGTVQSVSGKTGVVTLAITDIIGLQSALNAAGASGAVQSVNTKTGVVVLDKTDIGLDQVDNTSDINKPISSAVQTALDGKASIAIATTSSNGLLSSSDKSKLDGISTGATANSTDSFLLNRANHTGTQATNTISGLDTALAGKESTTNKNQPNGYAGLDSNGKISTINLPDSVSGALNYISVWDADTNTPTIPAAAPGNKGNYYKVSISGDTTIDGATGWTAGDWIVSNGAVWEKIHTQETISSVNTKTGVVVLDKTDIGLNNVDNTSDLNKPLSSATISALTGKASTDVVTTLANGLMSSTDKTKLDGVASGATANSTDLYLLNRDNHVGSQAISTITGLQSALDNKVSSSTVTVFGATLIASGDAANARTNLSLGTAAIQDSEYFALSSHTHTKANIGLDQVDNTSDANKPISNAVQTALNAKESTANKGQVNGYVPLDSTGRIPLGYITSSLVSSVNDLTSTISDLQYQVDLIDAASTSAPDIIMVRYETGVTGNFVASIPNSDSTLTVTGFTIYGTTFDVNNSVTISPFGEIIVGDIIIDDQISPINTVKQNVTYTSGSIVNISGIGQFTIASDGTYTFTPLSGFSGTAPDINYHVYDGVNTKTYTAIFLVQSNTGSLGDSAYKNTGTTSGTVAAGDDTRIMHSLQIKGDCNGGPPLIGTFAFGDVYRDITPLVSGFLYWQCIQSGVDTSSVWSGVGNVTLQHIDTNFSPSSNIVNGGVYTKTYTIVKSSVGDRVLLGFNTTYNMTDISLIGDVTSADTVTVTVTNNTGSTVNITPGSMLIRVIK